MGRPQRRIAGGAGRVVLPQRFDADVDVQAAAAVHLRPAAPQDVEHARYLAPAFGRVVQRRRNDFATDDDRWPAIGRLEHAGDGAVLLDRPQPLGPWRVIGNRLRPGAQPEGVQLGGHPAGIGDGELELQAEGPAVALGAPLGPQGQDTGRAERKLGAVDDLAGEPPFDVEAVGGKTHQPARAGYPDAGDRR